MKITFLEFSNKAIVFSGIILLILSLALLFRSSMSDARNGSNTTSASKHPTSHDDKMEMNDDHSSMMRKDSKAYKQMQKLKDEDAKNKAPTEDMSVEGINDM